MREAAAEIDHLTAERDAAVARAERLMVDCRILIANLDYVIDMTGEDLGAEDSAMVEHIRAARRARPPPRRPR